jgi:hypothetical protein
MTMFADMLRRDREVGQAAWLPPREYLEVEAGARRPTFETYDRITKLFGWPQTFADATSGPKLSRCFDSFRVRDFDPDHPPARRQDRSRRRPKKIAKPPN